MERAELGYTQRPIMGESENVVTIMEPINLSTELEERRDGTVYVTTHRIVFVDKNLPETESVALHLSKIKQYTENMNFLRTRSKVIIEIKGNNDSSNPESLKNGLSNLEIESDSNITNESSIGNGILEWKCSVCEHSNSIVLSNNNIGKNNEAKCELCGVLNKGIKMEKQGIPCQVCTFINHPDMLNCEVCESSLETNKNKEKTKANELVVVKDKVGGYFYPKQEGIIVFRFAKNNSNLFISAIRDSLENKSWEQKTNVPKESVAISPTGGQSSNRLGGISAIMQHSEKIELARDMALGDAFRDLEAISEKAEEMVLLARSIMKKISPNGEQQVSSESVSSQEFQKYLSVIGISDPVTK
ncbi:hypothetical protein BB559_007186 [Furculomyces boomerangus]|nr:hypothetical protein BB559_007186 [Furculomyces boomerangus]